MALETAIANALLAAPAVAAVVDDRVRPLGAAAADDRPYVAYQITSRQTMPTLSDGPGEYRKGEFDVVVTTERYSQAFELSDAVRAALDDLSTTDAPAKTEMHLTFDDETDVEEVTDDDETQQTVWVRRMTFRALYRAVP